MQLLTRGLLLASALSALACAQRASAKLQLASGPQTAADEQQEQLLVKYKNHSQSVSHDIASNQRPAEILASAENEQGNGAQERKEEDEEVSEELRKIWDSDELLRSLMRKKSHELPVLKASFSQDDESYLRSSENIFYRMNELSDQYRVTDLFLMALVAKSESMTYSDLYMLRYDSFNDLKLAAGPAVDNERCIRALENLTARAQLQAREHYQSRDINLFRLFDTWGLKSAGFFSGHTFVEGTYNECLRLRIKDNGGAANEELPTRYCVVSLKHKDWPKVDKFDVLSMKSGICIPKSCDSSNYKNKYELIMRLLMHNMRPIEHGQVKFHQLFCLPDEDSPLRSLRYSPQAMITLACLSCWLMLLVYCTYKHHQLRELYEPAGTKVGANKFGLTSMNAGSCQNAAGSAPELAGSAYFKLYKMLSITNNIQTLFSTSKESTLVETDQKLQSSDKSEVLAPSSSVDLSAIKAARSQLEARKRAIERESSGKVVDLSCFEGIKVIAMSYVIMGHVLMCLHPLMQNGREMASNAPLAFYVANMVPAFAVNTFFTITGILTCYLMFKQNQAHPFITSPTKWISLIIYRYLRIMPMYALVVLYCKTLAKYTGSGPLWDYGVSALSQRRICEQESWLWTLLFQSNYLPPLEHCIPSAWYLSNDFQFILVTPLYLTLLYKRPRMGQLVLYASIIVGYLNSFYSIFGSDVSDLRPIAMFAPHAFKTYVSHFSFNYTRPQYRIPAYLVGLLIGHNLYTFERARLAYYAARRVAHEKQAAAAAAAADPDKHDRAAQNSESLGDEQEPDWSETFKRYAVPISVSLIFLCCASSIIGIVLPFNKAGARFMVALVTPSYHVMFASAIGLYVLLATTGQGNKHLNAFLGASFWKPLARVSLCAVLVNVEVITYLVQSNSTHHYVSNQFHNSLNIMCILATYAVSIVVCVLFESPIRALLNTMLTYAISRATMRNKSDKTKTN